MTHTRSRTSAGAVVHNSTFPRASLLQGAAITIGPIRFGLDKSFGLLSNWKHYLTLRVDVIAPARQPAGHCADAGPPCFSANSMGRKVLWVLRPAQAYADEQHCAA